MHVVTSEFLIEFFGFDEIETCPLSLIPFIVHRFHVTFSPPLFAKFHGLWILCFM